MKAFNALIDNSISFKHIHQQGLLDICRLMNCGHALGVNPQTVACQLDNKGTMQAACKYTQNA